MSIGKVTKALQLLNQELGGDVVEVTTPITNNTYKIKPLRGKDEQELKIQVNPRRNEAKITEVLYAALYRHLVDNEKSYDEFLKSETPFDVLELFHGFNIATYGYIKDYVFTCTNCEAENRLEKLEYSQFKNTSEKWNEKENVIGCRRDIKLKIGNVEVVFNVMIPTLFHELQILRRFSRPATEELPAYLTTTSNLERCLMFTDNLKVIRGEEEIVLDNIFDIKTVLDELPENYIIDVINKYNDMFSKYVPVYTAKLKCEKCEQENEVFYHPIFEFITRLYT